MYNIILPDCEPVKFNIELSAFIYIVIQYHGNDADIIISDIFLLFLLSDDIIIKRL